MFSDRTSIMPKKCIYLFCLCLLLCSCRFISQGSSFEEWFDYSSVLGKNMDDLKGDLPPMSLVQENPPVSTIYSIQKPEKVMDGHSFYVSLCVSHEQITSCQKIWDGSFSDNHSFLLSFWNHLIDLYGKTYMPEIGKLNSFDELNDLFTSVGDDDHKIKPALWPEAKVMLQMDVDIPSDHLRIEFNQYDQELWRQNFGWTVLSYDLLGLNPDELIDQPKEDLLAKMIKSGYEPALDHSFDHGSAYTMSGMLNEGYSGQSQFLFCSYGDSKEENLCQYTEQASYTSWPTENSPEMNQLEHIWHMLIVKYGVPNLSMPFNDENSFINLKPGSYKAEWSIEESGYKISFSISQGSHSSCDIILTYTSLAGETWIP